MSRQRTWRPASVMRRTYWTRRLQRRHPLRLRSLLRRTYPNFQLIFDEQFTKDCAEGQALSVYGDRFFFYPATWDDTSNKGLYDPGIFSVSNGIANIRMRTRDGRPRVCAP